jgi:CO/xanthine dehydrogenase Mo-binding subunit
VNVGKAVPYVDALERVDGSIGFTINLEVPGMVHARVLRSPSPHARLLKVDVSEAESLPGVVAVLTDADFGPDSGMELLYGSMKDQPVVAHDKVRYIGEPIAVIAAEDPETAERALSLIDVEYEDLTPVFDPHEADAEGAPLVHDEYGTNVCSYFKLRHGDIEAGFAEADRVFEHRFSSPAAQQFPLEPHVTIASVDADSATVWTSTQAPYPVRDSVATILKLPEDRVRIVVPPLGGGYGAKNFVKLEPMVAATARKAGRPVKLSLSREEEFVTVTKHPAVVTIKTGVKADGTITARKVEIHWSGGAYADTTPPVARGGGMTATGPYRVPHAWVDSRAMYTNLPQAGSFRGLAVSQVAWAYESQMDIIADALGMDPLEFRLHNLIDEGEKWVTGERMDNSHYKELIREVADKIGWNEPSQNEGHLKRGKGLGVTLKATITPSAAHASLKLDATATLWVLASSVEMGQGIKTALAQIAADAVGVPLEDVRVVDPDTNVTPYDMTTSSSRSTFSSGGAIRNAAHSLRSQLLELAPAEMGDNLADVEIVDGFLRSKGSSGEGIPLAELLRRNGRDELFAEGSLETQGGLDPETGQGKGSDHWHQGAGAAEVEVDMETGKVTVLRYHAASYANRVVNPTNVRLQNEGNVVYGLGPALFEEIVFDNGRVTNSNLDSYPIPSLEDVPKHLASSALETPDAETPYGVGENTLPSVAPAIANAVFRATGVRIYDLPLAPEKVLRALRAKKEHSE